MSLGSLILGGCDYTPLSSSSTGAADTSPLVPPLPVRQLVLSSLCPSSSCQPCTYKILKVRHGKNVKSSKAV